MNSNTAFVRAFRESAPYINTYKQETFVILLSAEALASQYIHAIVHDIALLESLGTQLILCLESLNQDNTHASVIDNDALTAIKSQSGQNRTLLEALFSSALPNTPMQGANIQVISGNFITAKPLGIIDGIDHCYAGAVRRVNVANLKSLLTQQQIVLLPDLGYSSTGECFHVPYGDVGIATAAALGASKLIIYTNETLLKVLPNAMTLEEAEKASAQQASLPLDIAVSACGQGIRRVQLINHEEDGALLTELFTRDGSGSLISQAPFEFIQPATIDDVIGIMSLLTPLEQEGVLVKRDPERLEQEIHHFRVMKRDTSIIALAALYPFDDNTAELACVVTHPDYRGKHRAKAILAYIEAQAKQADIHTLFVLTTQSAHFFIDNGFVESQISELPQEKKSLYNYQRKSKVFKKSL